MGISSFPSWLTPPMAVGALVFSCSQTHTAEHRGPGASLLGLDPCVLHPKLASLSSSQTKLGIVRPGSAQEVPSQSPARCGLLLRHYPLFSSGSVLCLTSLVNSLDPNRIRDTSAVAQPAQWKGLWGSKTRRCGRKKVV